MRHVVHAEQLLRQSKSWSTYWSKWRAVTSEAASFLFLFVFSIKNTMNFAYLAFACFLLGAVQAQDDYCNACTCIRLKNYIYYKYRHNWICGELARIKLYCPRSTDSCRRSHLCLSSFYLRTNGIQYCHQNKKFHFVWKSWKAISTSHANWLLLTSI